MQYDLEILFVLLFAAILLVGISQKFHIPYPIALVLGGTAISFIPILPDIHFDPNLVLIIVLPPILYSAAFGISFREFKQNWQDIFSLAIGLVCMTTFITGLVFKGIFPQFSWGLAFAFGAIVSPPDAVAVTSILKRFKINSRLLTLLEGESLTNDASALVLYKLAVVAILSGTFSWTDATLEFIWIVTGGTILGIMTGIFFQFLSKKYLDPVVAVLLSFTIPYVTYLLAGFLQVSGVLAVVVNGLIGARVLLTHHSSLRRVLGYATWDIFTILLNCFVFILIGVQLRTISSNLTTEQLVLYTKYGVGFTILLVLIRTAWVYSRSAIAYFKALQCPEASTMCPEILKEGAITSWSGMRGIVSLTAASALPLTLPSGVPLEGRNEVIFITFVVILLTLVVPGLSLPFLLRWLEIPRQSHHADAQKIRRQLTKIAEDKLSKLLELKEINPSEFDFLKSYFTAQSQILEIFHSKEHHQPKIELIRHVVIKEQRILLLKLRKSQEIDDRLLMHFENELDSVEVHTIRAELN